MKAVFGSGLGPRPAQRLILGYLAAITVGAVLLSLPPAAAGRAVSGIDALFTSTSAVCVTGLTVLDTGGDFSAFGQAVILTLLQLGGLGVMTFSTFLLLSLGGRPSLLVVEATGDPLGSGSGPRLTSTLRGVFLLTVAIELAGALLLLAVWTLEGRADGPAYFWHALFHAVSAFCNAGFSTFSSSLEGFRGSLATNLVMIALIVAGGLGFVVLLDLGALLRAAPGRRLAALSRHSRLVLAVTAALILMGAAGVFLLEYDRALAGMPGWRRALAALFQSVTARTAGFNTLPTAALGAPTLFLLILLMFVGASPCSTGGGIKTTTLGILAATAWSRLFGRAETQAFGRAVPRETVTRATSLAILAAVIVSAFLLALLGTEPAARAGRGGGGGDGFLPMAFETVSAFGTVGLSTGATRQLSWHGKLLVSALMLVGRVGPLSLAVAFSRTARRQRTRLPEGEFLVG